MLSATAGIPRKVVAWLAVMNWALTTVPCPSPTASAICSAFSTPMNGPLLAWSCLSGGKVEEAGCVAPGEGGGVYAAGCALATAINAAANARPATIASNFSFDITPPPNDQIHGSIVLSISRYARCCRFPGCQRASSTTYNTLLLGLDANQSEQC